MTLTDSLMLAALAVFLLAWWVRATPARPLVLAASAAVALGAALAGFLDSRWQAAAGLAVAAIFIVVLVVNRLRKARSRRGAPFLSGRVFTLLGLVATAAIVAFPVDPLPAPTGPHAVGVREFELTDASRPGLLGAGPDEPRRLLVRVWYPAENVAGLRRRPYFNEAETRTTARGLGSLVGFPPFMTYLKHVRTNGYEDAPLLASADRFPVVFYSHGYTSFLAQNTVLMEDLASHGYVVFSLQHSYDAAPTPFADGVVLPLAPVLTEQSSEPPSTAQRAGMIGAGFDERLNGSLDYVLESVERNERIAAESAPAWLADRLFLHDRLQRGEVSAEIATIAGASNLERVGEMGMSFGGSTAGAVCVVDPRCAAGVNLDGGDYHYLAFDADIPTPFLMFHSDLDGLYKSIDASADVPRHSFNEFSYERIATAGSRPDVYRVSLRGARHLGLSDFSRFVRRPLRDSLFGYAPADVMVGSQTEFVRGFFDRHLKGEANDFPKPQLAEFSEWVSPVDVSAVSAWWAAKPAEEQARLEARIAEVMAATQLGRVYRKPSDQAPADQSPNAPEAMSPAP